MVEPRAAVQHDHRVAVTYFDNVEDAAVLELDETLAVAHPFSFRYPSACSACIILWICVVPS